MAIFIATGAFFGYSPVVPGTVGTALALLLAILFLPATWAAQGGVAFFTALLGIWASTRAEVYFNEKDPRQVVIDEMAGFFVTILGIPQVFLWWMAAFVLFRGFDVLKPPPIRGLQRLPGGWGIMADDLVAGIYANICLHLLRLIVGT